MMKFFAGASLAVALLSGTAMSAQAATTTYDRGSLGVFSGSDTAGDFFKISTASQMFDLAYTFTLNVAGYVSTGATNAYTSSTSKGKTTTTKISDFLLTVNGVNGLYSDLGGVQHSDYPPTSSLILLAPGTYNLDVTGKTGIPNSSVGLTFSFNAAPSTVPLPGTVALFGAALAGLGMFGAFQRKGKAAASA